jgi:hypothetical protein
MTIVMAASLTVVTYFSFKIGFNKFMDITAAASDDLDSLRLKHIHCTLTHVSRKHYSYTHLS